MKTSASHGRTRVRLPKTNRLTETLAKANGHGSVRSTSPGVSNTLRGWLAKPKCNLIAGKWAPAASGKTFEVFNPADGSVITRVPDSDKEDINRAVSAGRRAFDSGPWRR